MVYGRPAIAVPISDVRASVTVTEEREQPGATIQAEDIGRTIDVAAALPDEPLSLTVRNTLSHLGVALERVRLVLTIRSTISVASGMGSGAAVATALVRALAVHLGHPLEAPEVSALVYETEKIHHGTPSGIDNTVVAFWQPVCFRRGHPIEVFEVGRPFWLAIADSGMPSVTRETVGDVRAAWQRDPAMYERIFDEIGTLVDAAREAIECGRAADVGVIMNENQRLLRRLGVSSPVLEGLIGAALEHGAYGAKLSGGGRGGNVIALIEQRDVARVQSALRATGARNVIVTKVGRDEPG